MLGIARRKTAREPSRLHLEVLKDVQQQTIRPLIESRVSQGAQVSTDDYGIYGWLAEAGFSHETVNHSQGEYARGHVHTNTCEGSFSWVREVARRHRGVSKDYLHLYLGWHEFCWGQRAKRGPAWLVEVLQGLWGVATAYWRGLVRIIQGRGYLRRASPCRQLDSLAPVPV